MDNYSLIGTQAKNTVKAFSLLELMTSFVIIIILAAMLSPKISKLRESARSVQCASNLKNLFIATNGYIQDNQHWPQVTEFRVDSKQFAEAWLKELQPYSISKINWLCPTIVAETQYTDDQPFHLDYIPTPFGSNPTTPFLWPNHPWFSERGSVHGKGNLIITTNGSVKPLSDFTGSISL